MTTYRIKALFWRHLMVMYRDLFRFSDIIYWPLLDIIIFGMTSTWMQQGASIPFTFMLLTGLIFGQVITRIHLEIPYALVEEIQSKNLVNLFATPLEPAEWLLGVTALAFFKSLFTVSFGMTMVWLLYGISIMKLGWFLIPSYINLFIAGWWMALITTSFILTLGRQAQSLIWMFGWMLAPLCGVFYPVAILPHSLQVIAWCLPQTYILEGMRLVVTTEEVPFLYLAASTALNCLYATIMFFVFRTRFSKAKRSGLESLQER